MSEYRSKKTKDEEEECAWKEPSRTRERKRILGTTSFEGGKRGHKRMAMQTTGHRKKA